MKFLGISAYYHDSAAALVTDGVIVAAAQEERFSRKKNDPNFPSAAVAYCLKAGGVRLDQLDGIVFYEKPFLRLERLLETYLAFAPKGFPSFCAALPIWLKEKIFLRSILRNELRKLAPGFEPGDKLLFSEHHLSHGASAFFPSPFFEAAVLTMDGVGEWTTTSLALGRANRIEILKELHFPHSLGLLYSAFTFYTGFKVNSGEYKLMGLAPYGLPKYRQLILDKLIDLKEDGTFHLDLNYFDYCTGFTMTGSRFAELFGHEQRTSDQELAQFHMDIAASIQAITDEVVLRLARSAIKETGQRNLCLAGGVALNCVSNGKLMRSGLIDRLWIQPAAGDSGGALGAALVGCYMFSGADRIASDGDAMQGAYLGPEYSQKDIEHRLLAIGAKYEVFSDNVTIDETVAALVKGNAVGWMQGRAEFGPRALGARSILADPRSPTMQSTLNLRIKNRESFRPFAPSVLSEDVNDWFDIQEPSPYMLLVAQVAQRRRRTLTAKENSLCGLEAINVVRSDIPAVTHVDLSSRIQTVHVDTNPRYHSLISRFRALTGCPILVNTSFNVRGEPIVNSPEDAFRCFMGSEMEILVIGNCFLRKEGQLSALKIPYSNSVEPD